MRRLWLVLFLMAAPAVLVSQERVPDAAQFVGAPAGTPLTGEALERESAHVSQQLRCPVCQGLAISDSPSSMAGNMKEQVRELLARGYTAEQILRYFERSYGQFVLLKPKFQGVTALVWILPVAVLLIGIAIILVKVRRLEAPLAVETPSPVDPYVARVRAMLEKE